ncbi:MAG: hypothetical protein CVU38_19635 [Chloroflexi bacterium HGW-Chloroflexi-1]|nr:MAG: hypothetical protein CVU38_19635 [Chloroflexi bacterium HGW-Chloroflexi-1]
MNNPVAPTFKPDMDDTIRRWEAYWQGEILDRPLICVTAPVEGFEARPIDGYRERVFGDIDEIIDKELYNASGTVWGGESFPGLWPSFGPDEITVFCGAEFRWHEASGDTNWAQPFVEDWAKSLPLRIQEDHPLWLRMQEFYRRAAQKLAGKMPIGSVDLHTNMDILMSARGSEKLCVDLIDRPEMIDRAMADARAIFPVLWQRLAQLGRMDETGYGCCGFSWEGCAQVCCDFSAMISPAMFRRWVMPALEEEASIVKHAFYHWDGPRALVHANNLFSLKGLHTFGFVPDPGYKHSDCLPLLKRIQAAGKAVQFIGTVDEIKMAHKELKPDKVAYWTTVEKPSQIEPLLEWFRKNT